MIFDGLLRISLADGILNSRDLEIIFRIMAELGWTRQRMESWFHTRAGFGSAFQGDDSHHGYYQHNPQSASNADQKRREAFDILGLETGTSPEAIKKRFGSWSANTTPTVMHRWAKKCSKPPQTLPGNPGSL